MASVIDIIVWVFAAIGLVALTGVALYYIAKEIKKYKPPEQPIWPDALYMEKLGAQCPTGWVYRGENRNGENICQNYYNVPVEDINNCYAPGMDKQRISYFDKITDWDKWQNDPGKYDKIQSRCSWIKRCGPPSETRDPTKCTADGSWSSNGGKDVVSRPYASWIGVSDKC
jgi:hypothetical protein